MFHAEFDADRMTDIFLSHLDDIVQQNCRHSRHYQQPQNFLESACCKTNPLSAECYCKIIRPHRSDSYMRLRPIATDGVTRSVCVRVCLSVCILITFVSPKKTGEPIAMAIGLEWAQETMY